VAQRQRHIRATIRRDQMRRHGQRRAKGGGANVAPSDQRNPAASAQDWLAKA